MFTYIFNTLAVNKQTTPTRGHVTEPIDDTRQHVHTRTRKRHIMSGKSTGFFPDCSEVPSPIQYKEYTLNSQGLCSICIL